MSGRESGDHSDLDALLADLRKLVQDKVVSDYDWYRSHASTPRWLFRISGTFVILFSVAIPLLAGLNFPGDDLVVSLIALAIAALTGLNSFFRWERIWRSRRQTEFALAHLLSLYDLRIIEATHQADRQRAKQLAVEATRELLELAQGVTGAETEEFFQKTVWPQGDRQ
jgi:hypothetical protein